MKESKMVISAASIFVTTITLKHLLQLTILATESGIGMVIKIVIIIIIIIVI